VHTRVCTTCNARDFVRQTHRQTRCPLPPARFSAHVLLKFQDGTARADGATKRGVCCATNICTDTCAYISPLCRPYRQLSRTFCDSDGVLRSILASLRLDRMQSVTERDRHFNDACIDSLSFTMSLSLLRFPVFGHFFFLHKGSRMSKCAELRTRMGATRGGRRRSEAALSRLD